MFGIVNGWLNGYWLGWLSAPYPDGWFADPRFIVGVALFLPAPRSTLPRTSA